MIIFADRDYAVTTQTVTRKGEEVQVACRLVQYAPPTEKPDGKIFFPRLGPNSFYQVTIVHVRTGSMVKIKRNGNGWRVQHPDSLIKENWWEKKPTKVVKGDKTDWMNETMADQYLTRYFGRLITEFVKGLIAEAEAAKRAA